MNKYNFDKRYSLVSNIIWLFKLSFKNIPFITIAKLTSELISNTTMLLNSLVVSLLIDWTIKVTSSSIANLNYTFPISIFVIYGLIRLVGSLLRNAGNNLMSFQLSYIIPSRLLYKKLKELKIQTIENPEVLNIINRYEENSYTFNTSLEKATLLPAMITSTAIAIASVFILIPEVTILLILVSIPDIYLNKRFINNRNL